MAIQLSKLAVAWCQEELDHRGQMDCTFHDAALAGFTYENAITACHSGSIQADTCAKDVLTDETIYALLQNDVYEKGCDMPMAFNLRKEEYASEKENSKQFDLKALVDGANYKAREQRWCYVYEALKPGSQLIPAIKAQLPKQNIGNPNSTGRCDSVRQALINAELDEIKSFDEDELFWVRLKNHNHPLADAQHHTPPTASEMKKHGCGKVFRENKAFALCKLGFK
ncbi:MAG: hypothetical protein SGARI_003043 [Bacillariaceae sp.]